MQKIEIEESNLFFLIIFIRWAELPRDEGRQGRDIFSSTGLLSKRPQLPALANKPAASTFFHVSYVVGRSTALELWLPFPAH